MTRNLNRILQSTIGAAMAIALTAGAQTPTAPAPATPPAAPAAPAAPTWSVGPMDISGFLDGYYSYNANRPADQINALYNFNDKTDQFNFSAAKLTLNHDPDPVGAHIDLLFGRTDDLMNGTDLNAGTGKFIEQAFLSFKPAKAKGFEADFGKFVTSAGAEVIEAKDNWNYSRSLLFVNAIPYFHFGLRTSMPLSKAETVGVQVVNGWNNITANNGGATVGLTSAFVKPKATWYLNYYTGPSNSGTQKGYRNLIDTTLLLTPSGKFNAYINYDYGQNRDGISSAGVGDKLLIHWQGVAFAAHAQVSGKSALSGRYEYFSTPEGKLTSDDSISTIGINLGTKKLQEVTATYEYKWLEGLLTRIEYRRDWSDDNIFTKGNTPGSVDAQSTLTAGFVAFFGPKR